MLMFSAKREELFKYDQYFSSKLEAKKNDHTYRVFKRIIRKSESFPIAKEASIDGAPRRDITMWCSNDYLGLGCHPYVKSEVINAVKNFGAGSGGTRNISGSTPLHDRLERTIAKLHQKESALVFTSCYVANDTTLFTLAKMLPKCHILSDAGNHASMIQGKTF
jgi:5-aminolevulinate synthase